MPHTLSVFKTVTMPCQTTQQSFTILGLVAAILNCRHTHYNRSYMNPILVYTAYNLYTVTVILTSLLDLIKQWLFPYPYRLCNPVRKWWWWWYLPKCIQSWLM